MHPLPSQPPQTPWPTARWPEAEPGADVDRDRLERALGAAFPAPRTGAMGETHATVVVHRGRVVAERYAEGHDAASTYCSWSCAKSIVHAATGVLVRDGKIDLHAPIDAPEWRAPGDPRASITLDHLLRMSSGLAFNEDYVDEQGSDAIRMLFGPGKADVAAYAASLPLEHPVDTFWSYSSGTSNIVARALRRVIGGDAETYRAFLEREIFAPLGMRSAEPRFDDAGCWIGSSFVFARARDFARFGLLYLRDGVWDGRRILPEGWVDQARTPTPTCETAEYGAHWWLATDGTHTFSANGYRGQFIVCSPERDVIVVRHGASEPEHRGATYLYLRELIRSFPEIAA